MDESLKTLSESLELTLPEVKYKIQDFDNYYDNAQKAYDSWDYKDARKEIESYLDLTFPKSCRGYGLYAKILKEQWASNYIQYEQLFSACRLLIQVDNPERNAYFDNKITGDPRIDTWKSYFHELMYYEQAQFSQKAWDGVIKPDYKLSLNNYVPYLYSVLLSNNRASNNSINYNFYSRLLEENYYYKSYSLLLLHTLYKDKLTIDQKRELLYSILEYDNEICKNDCGSVKGVNEVTFQFLAETYTEDVEKELFLRMMSYITMLQENISSEDEKIRRQEDLINAIKNLLASEEWNILPFTQHIYQYVSPEFADILEDSKTHFVGIDMKENVDTDSKDFQYLSISDKHIVLYKSSEENIEPSNMIASDNQQDSDNTSSEDSENSNSSPQSQDGIKTEWDINPLLIAMSIGIFILIIGFVIFLFIRR